MSIALVLFWYLSGAGAAAWMLRRGHSATPWCVGGALLGGLLWLIALPCACKRGSVARWATEDAEDPGSGRIVVGFADEPGAVAATARSVSSPDDHLVIVHRLGVEATSSLVETGERAEAARRIDEIRRRWRGSTETMIGNGPPRTAVTAATEGRHPDLVIRGEVSGWSWRTTLRRSLAIGALLGCPILHASAGARAQAPVPRSARVSRHA